jgi:aminopeptidase N
VALEFTVAHEMVHQWFYGLVGNNQYAHAFIDEGLTNYLSASVYFERTYDEDTARQVMDRFIRDQFEDAVRDDRDPVVDQPTDDFPSGYDYVIAAYAKSPLGFEAIRQEIGDEAFFAGLQEYVGSFSFTVAEPDDLLAAFETASGTELDAIWDHWFEEQHGTDDVDD